MGACVVPFILSCFRINIINMVIDNLNNRWHNNAGNIQEGHMDKEWHELTKMTQGAPIVVERVRLVSDDIAIEGSFELPPLANLAAEDQIFVAAFIRSHGSIKQMEQLFGVSYPTIKNRLNRISEQFGFINVSATQDRGDVLARLERKEISVDEAVEMLKR